MNSPPKISKHRFTIKLTSDGRVFECKKCGRTFDGKLQPPRKGCKGKPNG